MDIYIEQPGPHDQLFWSSPLNDYNQSPHYVFFSSQCVVGTGAADDGSHWSCWEEAVCDH